ncbi:MAG: HlyD family efflux transporter periplasmic adaptor subunit [Acidobacteria bacterium]|nr:HlyD family efflux transporter periplasmic adaptor subunit [Acidobacteriota bacterium]
MFSSQSDMNSGMAATPMQMSGATLPNVQPSTPGQPGTGPQVVAPPEFPRRRSRAWVWFLLFAITAGAGYWAWQKRQDQAEKVNVVALRTAVAQTAPLTKSLRITGVTAAEKYVSLIAPSLRGGRGGGGASISVMGGGRGGGMTVTVSGDSGGGTRNNNSSSGSSTASATSSVASAGSALASTSGSVSGSGGGNSGFSGGGDTLASSAGGASSNLRSARSASGGASASRPTASRSSTRSATPSASSTLGSDGLGSTGSQMPGGANGGGAGGGGMGGGGGGRGSDFMMQIQMLAPNGTRVAKGDQVAEFDRQYMLLRLDDQKANVEQSESSMKASLATLEVTRKSYEQQNLAARNLVEKSELDMKTLPVRSAIESERLRLALEEAKANLKQLQEASKYVDIGERATIKVSDLELQASKLELRRAQANADRMVMKAPMDGLVVVQNTFRAGDFGAIQQGDQIFPGMMFMQVVDPSSMIINASVNQVDVQNLRLGQRAKVRFDAFPGLEVPAHLVTIGAITKSAGMRGAFKKEVAVKLRLDKLDPRIIPDLSVSADVVLEEADSATVVPAEALQSDASAAGAEPKTFVMIRNPAGAWERRDVQVGLLSNTHASIKSGLKAGEVVALETPTAANTDPAAAAAS